MISLVTRDQEEEEEEFDLQEANFRTAGKANHHKWKWDQTGFFFFFSPKSCGTRKNIAAKCALIRPIRYPVSCAHFWFGWVEAFWLLSIPWLCNVQWMTSQLNHHLPRCSYISLGNHLPTNESFLWLLLLGIIELENLQWLSKLGLMSTRNE